MITGVGVNNAIHFSEQIYNFEVLKMLQVDQEKEFEECVTQYWSCIYNEDLVW